jgi:hypothetical protein
MLARLGIPMAPPDHPIYKMGPLVVVRGHNTQNTAADAGLNVPVDLPDTTGAEGEGSTLST